MVTFSSVEELIEAAEREDKTISQITLAQTALDLEKTEETVYKQMASSLEAMRESVAKGMDKNKRSMSGLVGEMAGKMESLAGSEAAFAGPFFAHMLSAALAVSEYNACMGRIVAAPTAGSCGILPGCLLTMEKQLGLDEKTIVMGLFNASAIGLVLAKNATLAGAEGGCQAECGSAAAMAASAMTEIMGGSPRACGHAVAQVLKSLMGLVCDPVAGLVEEPCIIRNATCAAMALAAAQMSLAGIESIIPVDQVIFTMDRVGRGLPTALRETAEGGIAITPKGKEITEKLFGNNT